MAPRLLRAAVVYTRLAWWGLVAPRVAAARPLLVTQAVVVGEEGVLLSVRSDLRGWELPGGTPEPGESREQTLVREVEEETGLQVAVERHVGDWHRTGFRPHTAAVYRCRVVGGRLQPSRETPLLAWFAPDELPRTLFPWYREPLAEGLRSSGGPVVRHERHGLREVWSGLRIDLRMRMADDRAGLRPSQELRRLEKH